MIRKTARERLTSKQALLYGTLAVGVLDIAEVIIFYALRNVPALRVLQAIAAGLLGRAAFRGGYATAGFGLLLHFIIAFSVVAAYLAASRRMSVLIRHHIISGVLYGVMVYGVMNLIVVPLSAAPAGAKALPVIINGLAIHILGVGLPAALFARLASAPVPAAIGG